MFKCFAWLETIIIPGMVLRHVGYWRDQAGILWDVAIRANGERELIHTNEPETIRNYKLVPGFRNGKPAKLAIYY